jgi:hypothetical protein
LQRPLRGRCDVTAYPYFLIILRGGHLKAREGDGSEKRASQNGRADCSRPSEPRRSACQWFLRRPHHAKRPIPCFPL